MLSNKEEMKEQKAIINMTAKLEGGNYNLYSKDNQLIGLVKSDATFKESEISVAGKVYKIMRDGLIFNIYYGGEIIHTLKTSRFWGSLTLLEIGKTIKGVFGLKWGTQLVDEKKNTLLKIRNESQWVNTKKYLLEIVDESVSGFEILLSLFGHLYGSSMKQKAITF